jgi:hypothetical protein
MRNRLLRPFLILEFLIALEVVFTCWSQVGGQYHLDLMFWPWKFGVSVAAAALITGITADLARGTGAVTRRVVLFCALLIATIVLAGVVTYYYHLNEPPEEDQDSTDQPARVARLNSLRSSFSPLSYIAVFTVPGSMITTSMPNNISSCRRASDIPSRPALEEL